MNKKRIIKAVILPDEIKEEYFFTQNEDRCVCNGCGSLLFYIKKIFGVVHEELTYGIVGHKDKHQFRLQEVGHKIYCAECGEFQEIYFYEKVDVVCEFNDLDNPDKEEIDYCLAQYNQKKDYIPRYKTSSVEILKQKLKDFKYDTKRS